MEKLEICFIPDHTRTILPGSVLIFLTFIWKRIGDKIFKKIIYPRELIRFSNIYLNILFHKLKKKDWIALNDFIQQVSLLTNVNYSFAEADSAPIHLILRSRSNNSVSDISIIRDLAGRDTRMHF